MQTPKLDDLSDKAQKTLIAKTELDARLYQVALEQWRLLIQLEGPSFQEELDVYRKLQASLSDTCRDAADHPACVWYKLNDLQFFRMIKQGYAEAVPFVIPDQ